jgi:hypothetical protein
MRNVASLNAPADDVCPHVADAIQLTADANLAGKKSRGRNLHWENRADTISRRAILGGGHLHDKKDFHFQA